MMKLLLSVGFFFLSACSETTAVETPIQYVTLEKAKAVSLSAKGQTQAVVTASVLKDHHIQANPATLPNLIPTELTFEALSGVEVGKVVYPASKPWKLTSAAKVIQTYEGKVDFKAPLKASGIKPGKYELKGTLRYQACNDKNCFFPMTIPVSIPLTVSQ